MAGRFYFRGRGITPPDHGATFAVALHQRGEPGAARTSTRTSSRPRSRRPSCSSSSRPSSPARRPSSSRATSASWSSTPAVYVASCGGVVPRRVLEHIESEGGLSGDGAPRPLRRPALRLPAERREGLRRGPAPRREAPDPARGRRRDHRHPRRRGPRPVREGPRLPPRVLLPGRRGRHRPAGAGADLQVLRGPPRAPRWTATTTRSPTPSSAHFPQLAQTAPRRAGPARPAPRLARRARRVRRGWPRPSSSASAAAGRPSRRCMLVKKHLDALQDGVATPEDLRRGADRRRDRGRQGRAPTCSPIRPPSSRGRRSRPRGRRGARRVAAQLGLGTALARDRLARGRPRRDPRAATRRSGSGCSSGRSSTRSRPGAG